MAGNAQLIAHYRATHDERVYGVSSVKQLRFIRPWVHLKHPRSVLDYGCGQSKLIDLLALGSSAARFRYDPAIPACSTLPAEAVDLLINIDVLEHVEEADLDAVLTEMRSICRDAIIIIDTKLAKFILPDGRNAHVTVRPREWWHQKLARYFVHVEPIRTMRRSRAGFKTWPSSPGELMGYRALRARESAIYFFERALGRHKRYDHVSSTKTAHDC